MIPLSSEEKRLRLNPGTITPNVCFNINKLRLLNFFESLLSELCCRLFLDMNLVRIADSDFVKDYINV